MKKVLLAALAVLLCLAAVLLARALAFTLEQPPLPALPEVEVDPQAAAERLGAAIRFETVSRAKAPHYDDQAFEDLHSFLRETYPLAHTKLSTRTVGRHGLLFAWKGTDEKEKPILLMAHQDVVPVAPGTAQDWKHPPFSGAVSGGFVWGRGALDVKSGLVGTLEAAEMLLTQGFQPKRTVYLAFGHDEEIGGRDGAAKTAQYLADEGIQLEFVLDEGGVITQGVIPDVSVPVALIGVAEKGYVSLELVARTEGGHSSMPPSATAIGRLSRAIASLEEDPFPVRMTHSVRFFEFVGPKMPLSKRVVFGNLWLFKPVVADIMTAKHTTAATIRTTTAPTIFNAGVKDNVLPHEAQAVVNFRIIPGETPESVLARVREVVGGEIEVKPYAAEGKGFGTAPSPTSSIESDAYRAIAATIRGVSKDPEMVVAPYLVVGATDSRYFQPIASDVYRFLFNRVGPRDVPRIHGTNERIGVDNYADAIRFYYHLIRATAGD